MWLRACTLRAAWSVTRRSPLKLAVIVTVWSILLVGAYLLAWYGVQFVYRTAGVGSFFLDRLWYLFLFIVSVMLFISQLATAYSTMIRSEETRLWMSWPLSARWIVRAKWLESTCYSAWAAILLMLPIGVAYLQVLHKPCGRLAWLLFILLPLVGVMTAGSTAVLLVWLRWVSPRLIPRRELAPIGLVIMSLLVFWLLGAQDRGRSQEVWFVALQELLPRMQLASSLWMPSSWVARSLSACLNDRWMEASLFAGLLWSSAAVSIRLLDHLAAWTLLAVLRRHAAGETRSRPGAARVLTLSRRWWMAHPFWACVMKDLLLLIRDPAQWSQGLVFFGLLGAYFSNIHRLTQMAVEPSWRIGVASLNLACTLLVFGSLAVRFVFPQMSLEGRRLWLVHVAPGGLRQVLYAKLICYGSLAVVLTEGLLWVSATRLGVPGPMAWWLAAVGAVASFSLVGLTAGLGAWLIDPGASDPGRIVSSSNGALALVLMLGYIGTTIWALVVGWTSWINRQPLGFGLAGLGLLGASWLLGVLPVRRGVGVLERLEFST